MVTTLILILVFSIILLLILVFGIIKDKENDRINFDSNEDLQDEIFDIAMSHYSREIWTGFIQSKIDPNGNVLFFEDILNVQSNFATGVIIATKLKLSDQIKRGFFRYYKRDKRETYLIEHLSDIFIDYTRHIVRDIKSLEFKLNVENDENIRLGKPSIDIPSQVRSSIVTKLEETLSEYNNSF